MQRLANMRGIRVGAAVLIAAAAAVTTSLVARATDSESQGTNLVPAASTMDAIGEVVYPETITVIRTVEEPPDRVKWTFVSYRASDGRCLDVVVEQVGGGDEGRVSGCGPADAKEPYGMLGGVELGGRWYNVALGEGEDQASSVRVTFQDGTTKNSAIESGVWIAVVPDQSPLIFGVERVQQLKPGGDVLSTVEPASAAPLHRQAAKLANSLPQQGQ